MCVCVCMCGLVPRLLPTFQHCTGKYNIEKLGIGPGDEAMCVCVCVFVCTMYMRTCGGCGCMHL